MFVARDLLHRKGHGLFAFCPKENDSAPLREYLGNLARIYLAQAYECMPVQDDPGNYRVSIDCISEPGRLIASKVKTKRQKDLQKSSSLDCKTGLKVDTNPGFA